MREPRCRQRCGRITERAHASTVMNVFRFLHLSPRILCRADQALLGEARHDWGTYYDHDPHVMTGLLREGMAVLGARPRLQ